MKNSIEARPISFWNKSQKGSNDMKVMIVTYPMQCLFLAYLGVTFMIKQWSLTWKSFQGKPKYFLQA